MNILYRIFYRGFLKYHQNQCKPRAELVYAFTDSKGRQYHSFPSKDHMTTQRYTHLIYLIVFWDLKLSPKIFDHLKFAIIDLMNASMAAENPKDRVDNNSRAAGLMYEMGRREELGHPKSIFLEICATFAIREDEDPAIMNQQIHDEKIAQFAMEWENGHDFFFSMPALQKYLNLSRQSSSELKMLFAKSKLREEYLEKLIYHYLSAPTRARLKPITEP